MLAGSLAALRRRLVRGIGLAALALTASCSSDEATGPVPADEVSVRNNSFSPATRTVAVGTTVTFRWSPSANTHNVTFADGPTSPRASELDTRAGYSSRSLQPTACRQVQRLAHR